MPGRGLWSIGYEKAAWADFRRSLLDAGVQHVVDVRDLPLSRRAGFSKRSLCAGLADAGIGYTHLRALGTPPEGREANCRRQWPLFWQIVEARLETPEAELALQQAAELAGASRCCLLCYEADHSICHRQRVADRLSHRYGFDAHHLVVTPG